ncbi:electron transfer flavoprotein alpha subunit apoprotein [Dethiosulfatibacter aminovorans DSM 17477]|uniref:Electron transfer flavoprotein alpha subunit apoprotein n=1 Tax=Dethiosulfatibacter aminovorans DSM 17477 TaxID=1121476 RepID=A0A1M6IYE8_9FIRM|nr:electron transfer flavoprotein subunit alpha/FixB family protein [Dethiosulfatibacter aminovorans]SHJ39463.1 electron transfer flavoprotein alpha subunit apoprotein [Dethiosulfatibacter aminovorans DSM 17477]
MKIVGIINGYLKDYLTHIRQIRCFVENNFDGFEIEYYVFCNNPKGQIEIPSKAGISWKGLENTTGYLPEEFLDAVVEEFGNNIPDVVLFPGTDGGKELAARLGVRINGTSILGVESVKVLKEGISAEKPVYSSNLTGEFLMRKAPFCISISKSTSTGEDLPGCCLTAQEQEIKKEPDIAKYEWIEEVEISEKVQKYDLSNSNKILVFGKGVGSRESIEKFTETAENLGFDIGVSRPVAMNAWVGMEKLVGVSGTVCKPDVCIASGVSGAAAFSTGIDKSGFIVAINKDENAAIFKKSDIGIVMDYEKVLEEIFKLIDSDKD